jgi:hypothetical protein
MSPWIPGRQPVMGADPADYDASGDYVFVARRLVSEYFDGLFPRPPYVDGVYRQSLELLQQCGEYWFFEDEPEAFYAVPFGTKVVKGEKYEDYVRSRRAKA